MSKTGTIRTFICIELPGTVQALLAEIQACLKGLGADVSWVKPSNIHLTLKFLGDVPEQKVPVICVGGADMRGWHVCEVLRLLVRSTD